MPETTHDHLLKLIRGHQPAALLHVAARLGLADLVGDGCCLTSVAEAIGAPADALHRLVRSLASLDVFEMDINGWIRPTEASRYLRTTHPRSLHAAAVFFGLPMNWRCWEALERAIRTGASVFEQIHGQTMFDYLEEHQDEAVCFQKFMSQSPDDRHKAVVEAYDFSQAKNIVDVGGGFGDLLRTVFARQALARGILFDSPAMLDKAAAHWPEEIPIDRCRFVAGDFFQGVPQGGDVYVLSQILHDWNDERCHLLLSRCREAMTPTSRLLVVERLVGADVANHDTMNYLSDIEMLLVLGSRERSVADYERLFRASGLQTCRILSTASSFSLIEACRSDAPGARCPA